MMFQTIAIAVLIAFYGCYIAKMMSQKRKGIQTDQMGKGKVGFVKFIEVTMKISAILVFVTGLVSILAGASHGPVPLRVAGAVISALGTAFFIISVLTMRDSWRAGIPSEDKTTLVSDGIFQYSRNPAFLGFDLTYAGILLMYFNFPLLLFTLWAIVALHMQILQEEKFLIRAFGAEYAAYKARTGRYLGKKG